MGLSWQQGPLAPGAIGRFLIPGPLPERMLFAEPLRRRMRVRFGGAWIADSEDVVLLHEPGRYPVADTRRPLALYESGFAPRWYEDRPGRAERGRRRRAALPARSRPRQAVPRCRSRR
jgi:hypothetical protein